MGVIKALWVRNIKIFIRNRVLLVLTILIPLFLIYILTTVFKNVNIINPLAYTLGGIVIITIFQTSINIATSTVEDIVSGFMKEVLISPIKRIHIALGQLLASATICTFQGIIILLVGFLIGLKITSFITVIYLIMFMFFIGFVFSGFALFLACIAKDNQTFQVIEVAVTTPLIFLCGAYVPLNLLPETLKYIAIFNPMTYATAFFRIIILEDISRQNEYLIEQQLAFKIGDFVITPIINIAIISIFGLIFLLLSTYVFSKIDFSKIYRSKSKEDIFQ